MKAWLIVSCLILVLQTTGGKPERLLPSFCSLIVSKHFPNILKNNILPFCLLSLVTNAQHFECWAAAWCQAVSTKCAHFEERRSCSLCFRNAAWPVAREQLMVLLLLEVM